MSAPRFRFRLSLSLLALAACGGGDGGGSLTGPDDISSHTPASISLVSGGNQSVGPGQAVPVPPVLKVLSERNRPLRGATLVLTPDAGRGTLAAQSVVTGESGEATLPGWTAPVSAGDFSVTVSTVGASGPVTTRVTAHVNTAAQAVTSQTLGTGGGTVAVTTPGSAATGLTITVPAGALSGPTVFSISVRPAPSTVPVGATVASPLFQLSGPVTFSDSVIQVRLPATEGTGGVLGAVMLASDGTQIPVTALASDGGSVTIGLRSFPQAGAAARAAGGPGAGLRAGSGRANFDFISAFFLIRFILPRSGVHATDFIPARDAVGFKNDGSVWSRAGFCVGATMLSGIWWQRRFTPEASLPGARTMFPSLLTNDQAGFWTYWNQLNPAIRLASKIQNQYELTVFTTGLWKTIFGQSDVRVWANVLMHIWLYKQPVFLAMRTAGFIGDGHALLAYSVDVDLGRIYLVDPNDPDTQRWIQWNSATSGFDPFLSSLKAGDTQLSFIKFTDATWLFLEEAPHVQAIIDDFRRTGLRDDYPPWSATFTQANGQVTTVLNDATVLSVESRDYNLELRLATNESGEVRVFKLDSRGSDDRLIGFNSPSDVVRIPLRTGLNTIGLVFRQAVGGARLWTDAKVFAVTRAEPRLVFLTQPANAQVNQSLGPVTLGLVDENNQLVGENRTITLTLQGGSGGVLSGTTTANVQDDDSVIFPNLTVSQAGTGYTIQASASGVSSVTSAAFDIGGGGNATFTGRVYDGTQGPQTGLGGVTILVRAADGSQAGSGTSAANGDWSVSGLNEGTYSIEASRSGWVTTTLTGQVLVQPSTVVAAIPLVPSNTPGGISGNIRNASTLALITSSVTVDLRSGMNATTGATVASITITTGTYNFSNVPAGVYTISASASGYVSGSRTGVVVGAGATATQQDVLLSTTGAAARAVLTWGPNPRDLDSHLTGPVAGSGTRFWVYYASRGNCVASPFACLDTDQTNGNGPETVTIAQTTPGVYRYYVYDFTNRNNASSTALGASGAQVQLYIGSQVRTIFVPSGAGNAWEVFEWDGSNVTVKNRLYAISGTPMPALIAAGPEQEFRDLVTRMPPKDRR